MKRMAPFIGFTSVVLLWWGLTAAHFVPAFRLPTIGSVIAEVLTRSSELFLHTGYSLARLSAGLSLGIASGSLLGLSLRRFSFLSHSLYPVIESWRSVPAVALVPFFILWFGFSEAGKIILIGLGTALVITVSVYEAAGNIPSHFVDAGKVFGKTSNEIFRQIIWPGILPELRGGVRVAMAVAFTLVIVSEFMGADYGLGRFIDVARRTFNTPGIGAGIIIIGFVATTTDFVINLVFDRLTSWQSGYRSLAT